jgi:hypothetical protein
MPDGAVSGLFQRLFRETVVGTLELLQTGDIRLGRLEPFEQDRQSAIDAVHVEGGDAHPVRTPQHARSCPVTAPWRDDFTQPIQLTWVKLGFTKVNVGWGPRSLGEASAFLRV